MKAEPTEEQRRLFYEMIRRAFLDMRGLGFWGRSEQAAALAGAFHNLPIAMFQRELDWMCQGLTFSRITPSIRFRREP